MLIMLAVAFVLAQAPPLDEIAVSGTVADLKAAIGSGADSNQKDSDGVTPLMRAASAGRGDIVAALLAAGADAKAKTSGGVDALMMASLGGYPRLRVLCSRRKWTRTRATIKAAPR